MPMTFLVVPQRHTRDDSCYQLITNLLVVSHIEDAQS